MKTRPQAPQRATDCYDWISAEDVVRHALAAYYAACRYVDRGELDYPDDPFPHDYRATFADFITEILQAKLHDQGFKAGAPGFHGWGSERPAWWLPDVTDAPPERAARAPE